MTTGGRDDVQALGLRPDEGRHRHVGLVALQAFEDHEVEETSMLVLGISDIRAQLRSRHFHDHRFAVVRDLYDLAVLRADDVLSRHLVYQRRERPGYPGTQAEQKEHTRSSGSPIGHDDKVSPETAALQPPWPAPATKDPCIPVFFSPHFVRTRPAPLSLNGDGGGWGIEPTRQHLSLKRESFSVSFHESCETGPDCSPTSRIAISQGWGSACLAT